MMDGGYENPQINLRNEYFTAENIVSLFEKYAVATRFDHLTIDIDLNTFYVLHAVLRGGYRPRVIVAEFTRDVHPRDAFSVEYAPDRMWHGKDEQGQDTATMYMGASLSAYHRLFRAFGYHLLAADQFQINLYAVHSGDIGLDEVITLDEVIAGVQRGENWCSTLHPATTRTWVEIPEATPLAQAREDWYGELPRWNLTCLGNNADGTMRVLSGAQVDRGLEPSPAPWMDSQAEMFEQITCGPVRDVNAQVAELTREAAGVSDLNEGPKAR
jgi:hypothetical protein